MIELLIVVAIISILLAAIIIWLNPVQIIGEGRDHNRLSDTNQLSAAVALAQSDGLSLGSSSTLYISIPDPAATSTAGDQCQGLGLPALPTSTPQWVYHCTSTSTYRNVDGTGWLPINFSGSAGGSPFSQLPIDPINQTSTGLYYTYTTSGPGYEITSLAESSKEKNILDVNSPQTDYPGVNAVGTDLTLCPLYNPSGLVGYWKLDGATGTSTADTSNMGNTGTTVNSPTWVSGQVYNAVSLNGSNQYVTIPDAASLRLTGPFTISIWVKFAVLPATNQETMLVEKFGTNQPNYMLALDEGWFTGPNQLLFGFDDGTFWHWVTATSTVYTGQWYDLTGVLDLTSETLNLYVNGTLINSQSNNYLLGPPDSGSGNPVTIGSWPGFSHLNGALDDVRIYNRALSPAEVLALYNAER